jgi:hypothetical protein
LQDQYAQQRAADAAQPAEDEAAERDDAGVELVAAVGIRRVGKIGDVDRAGEPR